MLCRIIPAGLGFLALSFFAFVAGFNADAFAQATQEKTCRTEEDDETIVKLYGYMKAERRWIKLYTAIRDKHAQALTEEVLKSTNTGSQAKIEAGRKNVEEYERQIRIHEYREGVDRAQLLRLQALPRCSTNKRGIQTESDRQLWQRLRTGIRPESEERQEIGRGRGGPRVELASWTGPFLGAQLGGSSSGVTTDEFSADTGMRTNRFDDTGSSFSGGVNFGYNWQPWGNNVVAGVVVEIDGLHDSVRHDFPGGNYIGSVVDFNAAVLARGGVLVTPDVLLSVQTGVSFAHQQLKIDFGGPETNESQWTPGFTLGFGAEWILAAPVLQIGRGTSVFVDYRRTWWSTANLTMPAASPFFNYAWQRQTDGIDMGLRFRW